MKNYFQKTYKYLRFPKATETEAGLRKAQIGAIHAISSFFTLHKDKAAIIVMPTGSGKTAVLTMVPYVVESRKVLIVTPSVMVRGQIAEDISNLTTLCRANVLRNTIQKPIVFEMDHKYSEDIKETINKSDIVIATPICALSLSEAENIKSSFDTVLIDEAHHVPAKTWEQILINMHTAKQVLFTATPFRLDKKEIKGEMIYTYPLSMAYKDGIFGEIKYIPLAEAPLKNLLIAREAEKVFYADRELGYDHYLMVRTNTKENAKELEDIYVNETTLKLKRIDSSMSNAVVKKSIEELKARKLDGIICVDMLGEGFDFPNLKIAAVHSPHKSLSSTLQFIGRFARTNAENIGTAKFIAMNDGELKIENTIMYRDDAIWQDIIIDLSENKAREEEISKEYFKDFKRVPSIIGDIHDDISLHSIRPNGHAKIYKADNFDIKASFPDMCNISEKVFVNEKDNTIVGIGRELIPPKWIIGDNLVNINNVLYIVHYHAESKLLFIFSQNKTEAVYESIASAFCAFFERLPKYQMHRVLGNLREFEIFNSGMQNRYVESGESYRISAGSDVSAAIDPVTGKLFSPGHVFCKAADEGADITIGYSSGSKMWSSTYFSIPLYVKWCDYNGRKIKNDNISVKTNTNYDYLPIPKMLTRYPNNIFICDYDADTYISPPVIKKDNDEKVKYILTDISPIVKSFTDDTVTVEFCLEEVFEEVICNINGRYHSEHPRIEVLYGKDFITLPEYFKEHPLAFKTTDDVLIKETEYYEGNPDAIIFSDENIVGVDWDNYGTNIRIEVNDPKYNPTGISIHTTLKELLQEEADNQYIIYDHSQGEIADYITVKEEETSIKVTLYHVKKMSAENYNSSVNDIYEVAGQAIKSMIWFKTKANFVSKIKDRRRSGHCDFIYGDYEEFKNFMKKNKQLIGEIVIVQPSICKRFAIPDKIQQILASSNFYISNSGRVKSLKIWGSL